MQSFTRKEKKNCRSETLPGLTSFLASAMVKSRSDYTPYGIQIGFSMRLMELSGSSVFFCWFFGKETKLNKLSDFNREVKNKLYLTFV
jgi:hypothetical protein